VNESIFKDCWAPTEAGNILTINCIPVLVGNLILWALIFAGVIALIFIIFSGIKFITSGGDPKQVEGARKTLTFALAGLVLILLSFAILRFFSDITKLGCIREFSFDKCDNSVQIIEPERPDIKSTNYNKIGDEGSYDSLNCDPDTSMKACESEQSDALCGCVYKDWPNNCVALPLFLNDRGYCGPGFSCEIKIPADPNNLRQCIPAQESISCTCNTEGGTTPNNGFTCTDGTESFCAADERCTGTSTKPSFPCVKINQ